VRGLNTAATLWASAAVGACAGADLVVESLLGTLFVLAANTLLRPVANRINRQPLTTPSVEVTCTVYLITAREHQKQALSCCAACSNNCSTAGRPGRPCLRRTRGGDRSHAVGHLDRGSELDTLVTRLKGEAYVQQAFWSPSTTE
jgi:putative Mg2+ transporter-C (MgtC) family protein